MMDFSEMFCWVTLPSVEFKDVVIINPARLSPTCNTWGWYICIWFSKVLYYSFEFSTLVDVLESSNFSTLLYVPLGFCLYPESKTPSGGVFALFVNVILVIVLELFLLNGVLPLNIFSLLFQLHTGLFLCPFV